MRKFIALFLLFTLSFLGAISARAETVWADDSINELIIKQYDANKLKEEFLPALPESLKNEGRVQSVPQNSTLEVAPTIQKKSTVPKVNSQQKQYVGAQKTIKAVNSRDFVTVKKGTKFRLRIEQSIDDSARIGSKVYFTSLYPEVNKYITIPAGTKFIATIQDSHLPQYSANGGLLVLAVDEFVYKGRSYPIESKVIMVGNKRIFQNNIKGQHTYWKSIAKAIKPGVNFYSKSWKLTKKFAGDGLEIILTPITFVSGVTVLAVNTVASPAIALFSKGGRLFIKKGTRFQIKLMEDTAVYL